MNGPTRRETMERAFEAMRRHRQKNPIPEKRWRDLDAFEKLGVVALIAFVAYIFLLPLI
jgi:hypothetical protein